MVVLEIAGVDDDDAATVDDPTSTLVSLLSSSAKDEEDMFDGKSVVELKEDMPLVALDDGRTEEDFDWSERAEGVAAIVPVAFEEEKWVASGD